MKRLIIILLIIVSVAITADAAGLLNSEQAGKLVAAAWKQRPKSMDITYYKTFKDFTKDKEKFEQIYEEAFSQMYGPKESLSPAKLKSRDEMIQLNVERGLKEKEVGRKSKTRIRYDESHQRIDRVEGSPARTVFKGTGRERFDHGRKVDAGTPYTRSVIEVIDQDNVRTRHEYLHGSNVVSTKKIENRDPQLINEISGFAMIPAGVGAILRKKLSNANGDGSPNQIKIDQLQSDMLKGIHITIDSDINAPNKRVRIEIIVCNQKEVPFMQLTLICDKDDYSKVYSFEGSVPATDCLIRIETRSDFDFQGFPHNISVFEYDRQGKDTRHEFYQIESVVLNGQIATEDFEFSPVKDFHVVDYEMKPADQQAKMQTAEIARLKEWLQDENWTRRVRAIAGLKKNLREKPAELRDLVTPMQNDDHPQVRKAVDQILQSLESKE